MDFKYRGHDCYIQGIPDAYVGAGGFYGGVTSISGDNQIEGLSFQEVKERVEDIVDRHLFREMSITEQDLSNFPLDIEQACRIFLVFEEIALQRPLQGDDLKLISVFLRAFPSLKRDFSELADLRMCQTIPPRGKGKSKITTKSFKVIVEVDVRESPAHAQAGIDLVLVEVDSAEASSIETDRARETAFRAVYGDIPADKGYIRARTVVRMPLQVELTVRNTK